MTRPTKWTPQKIAQLRAMAQTMTAQQIAERWGVKVTSVYQLAYQNGISLRDAQRARSGEQHPRINTATRRRGTRGRKIFVRRWTEEEANYLRAHIGEVSLKDMAKHLGRTYGSVTQYISDHGISDEWQKRSAHLLTVDTVAAMLCVQPDTVRQWVRYHQLPCEIKLKYGRYHEGDVIAWLKRGHVLRLDRAIIPPYLQRIYDMVRREYYTDAELNAIDIPVLTTHRIAVQRYRGDSPDLDLVPIRVGNASSGLLHDGRTLYYRKEAVREWAWRHGHLLYGKINHADFADVATAWQTHYITRRDVAQVISENVFEHWQNAYGFPKAETMRGVYDRRAVVAWLKAHGYAREAHQLDRGGVLCYHELIRDREARHA